MTLKLNLPATPEIRRMAILAEIEYNLGRGPSAEDIVHHHITISRARGHDFAPWTADGDATFRTRSA